ncbi:MAG: hypothetical protein AB7K24_22085 [Gemmataceae bacterium]
MSEPILRVQFRRRVDLLRVRQRTRQLARLLGLELKSQLRLTAVVFELAYQLLQRRGRGEIHFFLTSSSLRAAPVSHSLAGYELPLDGASGAMTLEDVQFAIQQLDELTPLHPLEEMRLYDQELLWLLQQQDEGEAA